jgi:hypothetical protein
MSNAWYHYVVPLGIFVAFVIAGLISLGAFLRGGRDAAGRRKVGPIALLGAVFFLVVGGPMGVKFVLTSPTPRERERIFDHVFRTPPERIERFVIKAGTPGLADPLTHTDVVIDDPARVRRIADILRAAPEVSPNHPHTRWYAHVEMVTLDGTYYFSVGATVPGDANGTLVGAWPSPQGGWNLGDFRADGLDEVLEEAVNGVGKPN